MNLWEILAISLGVSLDAFALAVAIGLKSPRMTCRYACQSAVAITIPSIVMLLTSQSVAAYCLPGSGWMDTPFTPLALAWIGWAMIAGEHCEQTPDVTQAGWLSLLSFGCIASLDVGVAGLAMGSEEGTPAAAILLIPAFTFGLALTGLLLGSRLSHRTGRYAEITGGSLLLGIAHYGWFW